MFPLSQTLGTRALVGVCHYFGIQKGGGWEDDVSDGTRVIAGGLHLLLLDPYTLTP
jgi:hypothetical protein